MSIVEFAGEVAGLAGSKFTVTLLASEGGAGGVGGFLVTLKENGTPTIEEQPVQEQSAQQPAQQEPAHEPQPYPAQLTVPQQSQGMDPYAFIGRMFAAMSGGFPMMGYPQSPYVYQQYPQQYVQQYQQQVVQPDGAAIMKQFAAAQETAAEVKTAEVKPAEPPAKPQTAQVTTKPAVTKSTKSTASKSWAEVVDKTGVGTKQPLNKPLPPASTKQKTKIAKRPTKVDVEQVEIPQLPTDLPPGYVTGPSLVKAGRDRLPVCSVKHSEDECKGVVPWTQCRDINDDPIQGATGPFAKKSVHGNSSGSNPTSSEFCSRKDETAKPLDSSIYGCDDPNCECGHVPFYEPDKYKRRELMRGNKPNREKREQSSRAVNENGDRPSRQTVADFISMDVITVVTNEDGNSGGDDDSGEAPTVFKKSIDMSASK